MGLHLPPRRPRRHHRRAALTGQPHAAQHEEIAMTTQPIVAGVDGSEESLRAAEWAAREATARKTALRIVSAPALPPRMSPDPAGRETVAGVIHLATRDALARAAERAAEL